MNTKHALVIGNSDYQDAKLAKLTAPVEDVHGLVEVLRDPTICGFDEVTLLTNENSASALRTIAKFFTKKNRNDLLFLYFSGHGVLDSHGHLYLAFKDTEYELLSGTAVAANFITQEMDRCRSQRQVLIFDCCHSGAFSKGAKSALGARVGIASAFEGNGYGRIVLTASDSTQFAWEGNQLIGEGEKSLFTHYLIEGLRTGKADLNTDGNISLDELYDYVYQRILQHTPNQTPGKWSYKTEEGLLIARNPKASTESHDPIEEKQAAQATTLQPEKPEAGVEPVQLNPKADKPMNEKAPPRSSISALVALFIVAAVAAGWLYFQFFQGNTLGEEAQVAREEMFALQAEAQNANAPSFAEAVYDKAMEQAEQGEQELEEGNYTDAKITFEYAAELFATAAREASENLASAAATEEADRERQPALAARAEMNTLKTQAAGAAAGRLAAAAFSAALQEEEQAGREFEAGEFSLAEFSYKKAGELFKKARNEAQAKALEAETDLNAVRISVAAEKQKMQREKTAAEQVEAPTRATELFEAALQKERAGDRNFQVGTKNGYLAAQAAYADARDGYRNAAEAVKAKAREEAVEARRQEEARMEEKARTELREKAEEAKAAMLKAKGAVPGSQAEKTANTTYNTALDMEATANQQLQKEEFLAAGSSFQVAQRLYNEAGEAITDVLESKKAEALKPTENKRAAAIETEKQAEEEVKSLIDSYSQKLEGKDIGALSGTFKENENNWEVFFRHTKDISVDIKDEFIQIDNDTAKATFQINLSFFNTTKNSVEKSTIIKSWQMVKDSGHWRVVSQN